MEGLTLGYRPTTTDATTIDIFRNVALNRNRLRILAPLLPDHSEPTLFVVESRKSPVYQDENNKVFGIYRHGGHLITREFEEYRKQHLLSEIFVTPIPTNHFPLFFTIFENAYFPNNLRIDNPTIETEDYKAVQKLYDSKVVPTILRPRGFSLREESAVEKAKKVAFERMHVYARKLDLPTLDEILKE